MQLLLLLGNAKRLYEVLLGMQTMIEWEGGENI